MCGIAGISLNPSDTKLNVAVATAELLRGIASRGGDATGAAWYDPTTDSVKLTKVAVQVSRFLEAREAILPETTPVMILHTRFATVGDRANRLNNHPIQYSNIIGVHNGCLWDHKGMFKDLGLTPHAEVDSEAIMALLSSTTESPADVMSEIAGDAALAWIDLYEPEVLHLARVVDRPLCIGQTEEGSLIFASTMYAVRDAARKAGVKIEFELDVPEAKYLKVVGGVIAEYLDIPGIKVNRQWSQKFAYTSGSEASKPAPKGTEVKALPAKPLFSDGAAKFDGTSVYKALARMATSELVTLVTEGSVAGLERLELRGLDGRGFFKRFITDATVLRMAEGGDVWATGQIAIRKLDNSTGQASLKDCTLSELVTKAAGGSTVAKLELEKRGYNAVGMYVGDYKTLDDMTLCDMSTELHDQQAIDELADRGLNMFGQVIPVSFRQQVSA